MSAAEATFTLRGKEVTVREGDLILTHDHNIISRVIGPFNSGWSHVATVVAYQGRLLAFSVYMPPDGLTFEAIERFNSDYYARLAIVRPDPPRTAAQTLKLRQAVADIMRQHAANPRDSYDHGLLECFHALFKMQPYSNDRYICSELAARLAQAAGAWPAHRSVSVKIDDLARIVGRMEIVF